MKFRIVVHAAEAGGYWAEIPAFPGVVAVGATLDEVHGNARQAVLNHVLRSEWLIIGLRDPALRILEIEL